MTAYLLVVAAAAVGSALTLVRWLRVAQREHYEPGRVLDLARVWVSRAPGQALLYAGAVLLVVLAAAAAAVDAAAVGVGLGVAAVAAGTVWPRGLAWRGQGRPFALTPRARRLTAAAAVLLLLELVVAGVLVDAVPALGVALAAALPLLVPGAVEVALLATRPLEARLARGWVDKATATLRRVRPTVVAITGSFGKTSTKNYVGHLVEATRPTVVSPASFNNRLGLARAVNDRLVPGTEVFVAEMGTYGPGEIAALCELFPPDVACMTAIGDVHLERMGSRAGIVAAKREITVKAPVVVLNTDSPELAALVPELEAVGKRVVRCGTRGGEDVTVTGRTVLLRGEPVGDLAEDGDAHPTNVACAVGIADALSVPAAALARRLGSLPTVAHRAEVTVVDGVAVVDDTYNSNPQGARAALDAAERRRRDGGRLVVVTPGMIEMGDRQDEENAALAEEVVRRGGTLVVVGHVNRRALLAGVRRAGTGDVRTVASRPEAVALVAGLTGPGDAVLYENDLPDHYP